MMADPRIKVPVDRIVSDILSSDALAFHLQKLGQRAESMEEQFSPVETGRLKQGWGYEIRKIYNTKMRAQSYSLVITNRVAYARFQEFGTKFHTPNAILKKFAAKEGLNANLSYNNTATIRSSRRRRLR